MERSQKFILVVITIVSCNTNSFAEINLGTMEAMGALSQKHKDKAKDAEKKFEKDRDPEEKKKDQLKAEIQKQNQANIEKSLAEMQERQQQLGGEGTKSLPKTPTDAKPEVNTKAELPTEAMPETTSEATNASELKPQDTSIQKQETGPATQSEPSPEIANIEEAPAEAPKDTYTKAKEMIEDIYGKAKDTAADLYQKTVEKSLDDAAGPGMKGFGKDTTNELTKMMKEQNTDLAGLEGAANRSKYGEMPNTPEGKAQMREQIYQDQVKEIAETRAWQEASKQVKEEMGIPADSKRYNGKYDEYLRRTDELAAQKATETANNLPSRDQIYARKNTDLIMSQMEPSGPKNLSPADMKIQAANGALFGAFQMKYGWNPQVYLPEK